MIEYEDEDAEIRRRFEANLKRDGNTDPNGSVSAKAAIRLVSRTDTKDGMKIRSTKSQTRNKFETGLENSRRCWVETRNVMTGFPVKSCLGFS